MAQHPSLHAEAGAGAEPPGGREALRRHGTVRGARGVASAPATGWRRSGTATTRRATLFIWIAFSIEQLRAVRVHQLPAAAAAEGPGGRAMSPVPRWASSSIGAFFGSIGGAFLIRWFGSRWVGTLLALLGVVATAMIGCWHVRHRHPDGRQHRWRCAFLAGVSFNGMQAFMYAVAAQLLPDRRCVVQQSAWPRPSRALAQSLQPMGGCSNTMVSLNPQPPVGPYLLVCRRPRGRHDDQLLPDPAASIPAADRRYAGAPRQPGAAGAASKDAALRSSAVATCLTPRAVNRQRAVAFLGM